MNISSRSALLTSPSLVAAVVLAVATLRSVDPSAPVAWGFSGVILSSILLVRGVPRRRLVVGVVMGLLLTAFVEIRTVEAEREPRGAFRWRDVAGVRGRVVADLRPSGDTHRRLDIVLDSVEHTAGWRGSAEGVVTLLWSGEEHIALQDGSSSIVPVRGDTVVARDVRPPEGGAVWVDPTQLRGIRAGGAAEIRRSARRAVRRRLARLEPTSRGLVAALLLGTRADMASDIVDAVRRAGASHVIALSGMHLGVLALLVSRALRPVGNRRAIMAMTAATLGAYVWIAGWIPSLVRALTLSLVVMFARFRDRAVPSLVLLARCVLCVSIVAQSMVTDVGFRLSVCALLGLMTSAGRICDGLTEIVPRRVAVYLGTTISAMLCTVPLTLAVFGTVYPVAVVSAGILSMVVVVTMWFGIAFLFAAQLPIVGSALALAVEASTALFLRVVHLAARAPGIDIAHAGGGWSVAILVGAAVLCGAVIRIKRVRRLTYFGAKYGGDGEPQLGF
ncbi:MAG: ComEC/Rec2 family competence protein [Spirochaetales bacterium]|nr:ComEC/Rec2 family competence protein [Spirochaetales bacterium]